jgi:hypothetical protein
MVGFSDTDIETSILLSERYYSPQIVCYVVGDTFYNITEPVLEVCSLKGKS